MKKIILLATSLLAGVLSVKSQITTGLVAHYEFAGNTNDSHNNNNGAVSGTTSYGVDRFGQPNSCFLFDGSTSINLPSGLSDNSSRSISLWFATSTPGGLIGHNDGVGTYTPILYVGSDNKLHGKYWDGVQGNINQTNYRVTDSLWHHVVITGDNTGQKLYLDGTLLGSINVPISSTSFPSTQIGNVVVTNWSAPPSNTQFLGAIDDVRLYDTVISASTVATLLNTPAWNPPAYPYQSNIVYVNPLATGNNNGATWADAYIKASDAFINAIDGNEIWIAQGTYTRSDSNRYITYGWLVDSIKVYGGFSGNGTETSINQRDWDLYPTIFSGDLGVVGDSADNAYTVFYGPAGSSAGRVLNYAYVDGIKIKDGNSDVDSYPNYECVGGGMIIDGAILHISLNNIEFYNNYAKQGGAISADLTGNRITKIDLNNVIAHHNKARSSAVIHARSYSGRTIDLTVTNSLFYNNKALNSLNGQTQDFGTVFFAGANSATTDVKFVNNTVVDNFYQPQHKSWGVFRLYDLNGTTNAIIQNNIFYGNSSGVNQVMDLTDMSNSLNKRPFDSVTITNNILENGHNFASVNESGSLTSDPLFVNPSLNDYELTAGSPAVNSGSISGVSSFIPTTDLLNNARVAGATIDRGAYEYGSQSTASVDEYSYSEISVYPNPANDFIKFRLKDNEKVNSLNILNLSGQKMLIAYTNENTINISSLKKGMYLLDIEANNRHFIVRFIKQ